MMMMINWSREIAVVAFISGRSRTKALPNTITPSYESEQSVEDLQWTPTESTVLAEILIVPCWAKTISINLVATGADHGTSCVWDLRNFLRRPRCW
jgi:hypothetical protein